MEITKQENEKIKYIFYWNKNVTFHCHTPVSQKTYMSLRTTSGEAKRFSGRNSTGSTQGCHKYIDVVDRPRFEATLGVKFPILKVHSLLIFNKPEWFKIILYLSSQKFYSNMFSNKGNIIFQKAIKLESW